MHSVKASSKTLSEAINYIKAGGVVILPTDTVYGLVCDASNKKAVEKIYKIKKRPKFNPLPIFVKDIKMARELAVIDKNQEKIISKKWPGKYTFVLKRTSGVRLFGIEKKTIALRVPKYKFLNNLLKEINKPLAQTSANISGNGPSTKILEVVAQFKDDDILFVDAGDLPESKPSVIIDLTNNKVEIIRK